MPSDSVGPTCSCHTEWTGMRWSGRAAMADPAVDRASATPRDPSPPRGSGTGDHDGRRRTRPAATRVASRSRGSGTPAASARATTSATTPPGSSTSSRRRSARSRSRVWPRTPSRRTPSASIRPTQAQIGATTSSTESGGSRTRPRPNRSRAGRDRSGGPLILPRTASTSQGAGSVPGTGADHHRPPSRTTKPASGITPTRTTSRGPPLYGNPRGTGPAGHRVQSQRTDR